MYYRDWLSRFREWAMRVTSALSDYIIRKKLDESQTGRSGTAWNWKAGKYPDDLLRRHTSRVFDRPLERHQVRQIVITMTAKISSFCGDINKVVAESTSSDRKKAVSSCYLKKNWLLVLREL